MQHHVLRLSAFVGPLHRPGHPLGNLVRIRLRAGVNLFVVLFEIPPKPEVERVRQDAADATQHRQE